MRIVIQRVKEARVTVQGDPVAHIGRGMLVFLGVEKGDTAAEVDYFARKTASLRLFPDRGGKMNLAAGDVSAAFLVVSQFTLCGDCDKGRRPSFDRAAEPAGAERLYQAFIERLRADGLEVASGTFQAMMDVSLINDGPVTFILEGRAR